MKAFEIDIVVNEAWEHTVKKPTNAVGWDMDVRNSYKAGG